MKRSILYLSIRSSAVNSQKLSSASAIAGEAVGSSSAKPFEDIPQAPTWNMLWSMGFDKEGRNRIDKVVEKQFDKLGPIFKFSLPWKGDNIFVKDPEQIKVVLSNDGKYPIKPDFDAFIYYRNKIRKELFSETGGLLGSHGEEWYKTRSLVQQDMLRSKSALYYINDIEDISEESIEVISNSLDDNSEVEDLLEIVYKWSLESIASIFLGTRLNCIKENLNDGTESKKFIDAIKVVLGPDAKDMVLNPPVWKYISTPGFRRFDEACVQGYNISKTMIDKTIAELQSKHKDNDGNDIGILEKFIQRCGKDSQIPLVMSQDAIGAGVDTTGVTASFFLLDLAKNPDKQQLLYEEVKNIIGKEPISESKLNQMRYLKACLHESQRVSPAVFGFSRQSQVDMVLEGYQIPKGVQISYCVMIPMRDPSQFPEPEKYLPERWLRGNPLQHQAHPFASIIFSHGPRSCIGRRFAELECYILAIKLLQKYKLEYHHQPIGCVTEFVNKPDNKIKLRLIPRN